MHKAHLQQLMVINKRGKLPFKLKIKSFLIDVATWGLWVYVGFFIYSHAESIITLPIIENYLFSDILLFMLLIVATLLIWAMVWSLVAKDRDDKKT